MFIEVVLTKNSSENFTKVQKMKKKKYVVENTHSRVKHDFIRLITIQTKNSKTDDLRIEKSNEFEQRINSSQQIERGRACGAQNTARRDHDPCVATFDSEWYA